MHTPLYIHSHFLTGLEKAIRSQTPGHMFHGLNLLTAKVNTSQLPELLLSLHRQAADSFSTVFRGKVMSDFKMCDIGLSPILPSM